MIAHRHLVRGVLSMTLRYLLLWFLIASACGTSSVVSADGVLSSLPGADGPIVIVALGDSITKASRQPEERKWTTLLEKLLTDTMPGRRIKVINSGVGGNTSREGLARINHDVLAHTPHIVLVEFGGNDATQDTSRHVTLEEFRSNLEKIRSAIQKDSSAQVVMLTFPPVVDEWHAWRSNSFFVAHGGADKYVEGYREATRNFAECHGFLLCDIDRALRSEIKRTETKDVILPDGVHLTERGNSIVAHAIAQRLLASDPK